MKKQDFTVMLKAAVITFCAITTVVLGYIGANILLGA